MQIGIQEHRRLKEKYSTYIRTNSWDTEAQAIIKSFTRAYYHVSINLWELPYHAFRTVVSTYKGDIEIIGDLPADLEEWLDRLDNVYDKEDFPYESKTKPYSYQMEAFNYAKSHPKFLLADQMGLGKTKMALDIAMSRRGKMKHCLIVCGVNGLKYNWYNEIKTHTTHTGYILGTRVRHSGKEYIGSINDRVEDLKKLHLVDSYFIITNIETLRNKDIQSEIKKLCDTGVIGMTIIDEIHKCKNSTKEQGKSIHACSSYYKLALTGTPLMNNAIDVYNILKWLEIENHTLGQFKSYHCELGGFGGYEIISYKHIDELQEKLNSVMLRRDKNKVLDLPPKVRINEYVEMNNKQTKIYNEIRNQLLENIDKIMLNPNPLVELTRLRQATSYTGILSTEVKESCKFTRCLEIVKEVVEDGGKLIIFSNWTSVINPLFSILQEEGYNPALVTGEVKDTQVEQTKFKTQDDCKVVVGTIACLGTGFTLTEANTVIFLDEPWTMATKEQAEDRAHRVGTDGTVNIITLLCKDTADEKIHDLIVKKGLLSTAIVDNTNKITDSEIRKLLE